jgi:serine/threonine-protein kinase
MPAGTYVYARLAPDGRRIAFQEQYDGNDIWIWNADAGTRTRLTVGDADGGGWYPVWGADGHRVAYGASGVGLAWKSADNTGTPEVLVDDLIEPGWPSPYQFFEDGGLLFRGGPRIWIRRPGADPVSILDESTPERSVGLLNAHRSPNGRWLAYQSDESGAWEVYVRPFPVADSRVQVSNAAGVMPRWSSDAELLYVEPEGGGAMEAGAMISVSIDPESPVFAIESRTRLIDWPYEAPFVIRPWDLSADGRRFLSIKAGDDAPPRTVVVQNWFEELGRLAPTGR